MTIDDSAQDFGFINGGGEMAEIIRSIDWSGKRLGPPSTWPDTLKVMLGIILNSKFPMFIWWGKDLNCFYNDAYRPSLGIDGKHPSIIGMPAKDAWPETWKIIKPLIDSVLQTGEAIWRENQLIPIYRNGGYEDVYWTFSYSPIFTPAGDISGILVTCTETTESVKNLQRLEESEDKLRFAIEAGEFGTWDYNPLNNKFISNTRLKKWFGLDDEAEIELDKAIEIIHKKDRARVVNAINKALDHKSGGKYEIEYKIINHKTAKERVVRAQGRAWFDKNKTAYRFNGTLQDITQHFTAEQERQKLISLMGASQQLIALADTNLKLQYCNPAGKELLGITALEGRTLLDCIYKEDLPRAKKLIESLKKEQDYFSEDIRCVDPNTNKTFWINWNCVAVKDSYTDKIVGIGTVSTNIEMSIQKERALIDALKQIEAEERRFRNLVQNAPVGIAILKGTDYKIELANKEALKILDKTEAEVKDKGLFQFLRRKENNLHKLLKKVLRTGESQKGLEFSIDLRHKGKTEKTFFNFIFHPITDEISREKGIMVLAYNVTESVKFKNFLQESEKQFRNFVLQSPIAMTILQGPDLVVRMANKVMYETLWRKKRKEVIGKKLLDIFPELNEQKYPEQLNHVLKNGKSLAERESHAFIKGDDGIKEFYLDYEYAPLREVDGTISGVMATVNDVTDKVIARKALEKFSNELEVMVKERTEMLYSSNQQLKKSVAQLEKTNEELESFAYVSSHDLQEPLRKIQIFSSRILDNYGEDIPRIIEEDFIRITKAATRMRTLIEDLLAFSMTTDLSAESKSTNLKDLLIPVIEEIKEKGDHKTTKFSYGKLCDVKVVPFQMQQILTNLIENSLKFAKEGVSPIIKISSRQISGKKLQKFNLEKDKTYCKITYKDNGIGFEAKYGEQIFDVFQRLHGKEHYQGTGIGLAIVKKIIQNHNGYVEAYGKLGEGATFIIYLPLD